MQVTDSIGLLTQVPLVGIFVWFALQWIRIFTDSMAERDEAWREFIEQQSTQDKAFLKQ